MKILYTYVTKHLSCCPFIGCATLAPLSTIAAQLSKEGTGAPDVGTGAPEPLERTSYLKLFLQ